MSKVLRHICGEIINQDEEGKFHHRFDRDCELPSMTKCPLCKGDLTEGWFRVVYKVEPMTRVMMESTISNHFSKACSNCWGYGFYVEDVFIEREDGKGEPEHLYYVLCVNCREETQGYVSSGYIGYVRRKDYEDYGNSIISLAPIIGLELPKPKIREGRTMETIFHELGF